MDKSAKVNDMFLDYGDKKTIEDEFTDDEEASASASALALGWHVQSRYQSINNSQDSIRDLDSR